MQLILPGDPEFDLTLATPPPDWREKANRTGEGLNFIFDGYLFRSATTKELEDYLYGGEYEEIFTEEDEEDQEINLDLLPPEIRQNPHLFSC